MAYLKTLQHINVGFAPSKCFFDAIKRQKLRSMEDNNKKVSLTTSQGKLIQYQEQSDLAFRLLVKSQLQNVPIDLDILMGYSLAPVPHCLGTPDGFFAKTNKASMMHFMMEDHNEEVTYPKDSMFIQDGNALFHTMTNLAPTFGGISLQLLDLMVPKRDFVFSTDSYHPGSIKTQERLRRGYGEQFLIGGSATRKPRDFKEFLSNDENKKQLCKLILDVWASLSAASNLQKCNSAVLVVDGKAHKLDSVNDQVNRTEIHSLQSNQEETDTRIVLYLKYAKDQGFKSVVVRTPDTDIFFILLLHAHDLEITIYVDIGTGKKRRLINISELASTLGKEWCTTLLGFYVFTGEDCTSAFKGKGKVTPLKKLLKTPKFHKSFSQLGDDWEVAENVCKDIEVFTCTMYGYSRETLINVVRRKILKKMVGEDNDLTNDSKVDLSRLPPCQDSLLPHIYRVNHRVASYKRANIPIFEKRKPNDEHQGWSINEAGILEPVWTTGSILPQSLIDLLDATNDDESDEEEIEMEPEDYDTDDEDEV